jgi:parvulin-like peptidyl-prolyl isomerase
VSLFLAFLALVPLNAATAEKESDEQRVVLEIGQAKTTLHEFLLYLKQNNPLMDFVRLPESEQRDWIDEFVAKRLFALRAREARLDQTPEVRARIDFFVDSVLAQEFKDKIMREINVPDEDLEAYYRDHREEFKLPPRVHLQHFLYKSAEKASRARSRMQNGAAFADLAEEKKTDSDVILVERKWFEPSLLIPELAEIAFRLPAGKASEVVRSSYGYHVLRVEDQEPARYADLAAVRHEILDKIRQARASELYREILKETRRRNPVRLQFDWLQP